MAHGRGHGRAVGVSMARCGSDVFIQKDKGDKLKSRTDTVCPQFYQFQSKHFKDVPVKYAGASKKGHVAIWCSQSFMTHLFHGKDQEHATIHDPVVCLNKLIEASLPAYGKIIPDQFSAYQLLEHHNHCIDLAFLEAVWRYSRRVTAKRFSCGDFTPSPTFAKYARVVLDKYVSVVIGRRKA